MAVTPATIVRDPPRKCIGAIPSRPGAGIAGHDGEIMSADWRSKGKFWRNSLCRSALLPTQRPSQKGGADCAALDRQLK
jgi:hypothetical protein